MSMLGVPIFQCAHPAVFDKSIPLEEERRKSDWALMEEGRVCK